VNPDDAIGTLDDFEPIKFCNPYPTNCLNNTIDAAIALSSMNVLKNETPSDGYGVPRTATELAKLRLRVMKYGRTTGLTNGRISAINGAFYVNYGPAGIALFTQQIVIKPGTFSAGGDSGSLIVIQGGSNDRTPVGLLFAGSSSVTIANPIGPVLQRFGVAIDGN
jgi:hypothetical protein